MGGAASRNYDKPQPFPDLGKPTGATLARIENRINSKKFKDQLRDFSAELVEKLGGPGALMVLLPALAPLILSGAIGTQVGGGESSFGGHHTSLSDGSHGAGLIDAGSGTILSSALYRDTKRVDLNPRVNHRTHHHGTARASQNYAPSAESTPYQGDVGTDQVELIKVLPGYGVGVMTDAFTADPDNPVVKEKYAPVFAAALAEAGYGVAQAVNVVVVDGLTSKPVNEGIPHGDSPMPERRVFGVVENKNGEKFIIGANFKGLFGAAVIGRDKFYMVNQLVEQDGAWGVVDKDSNFIKLFDIQPGAAGHARRLLFSNRSVEVQFNSDDITPVAGDAGSAISVEATATSVSSSELAAVTPTPPEQVVTPNEVATPTPEQLWQKQVEKWKIDPATVTSGLDTDGKFVVKEKDKDTVIYSDGSWNPKYLSGLLVSNGECKVTDWVGAYIGSNMPKKDLQNFTKQYLQPLYDYYRKLVGLRTVSSKGGEIRVYYMGNGCWGEIFFKSSTPQDAWMFWKDSNGRPMYEQVFLTEK